VFGHALTSTSIGNIWIAIVAHATVADVARSIGRVVTVTVGADAGIVVPLPLLGLLARLGLVVPDGPVQPHRHRPVAIHLEVCGVKGVVLVYEEGVVARAEVQPILMGVRSEVHVVVGEAGREVDMAAPDAGADAVHGARGVVAEAHAAGVVGVGVVVAFTPLALGVAQGVAADDDDLVPDVGDAVHAGLVELHVAVVDVIHLVRGVVALPGDGQHHERLRRADGEVAQRDRPRGAEKHRRAAVADDLETRAVAAGADAERVSDGSAAAAVLAAWESLESCSASHDRECCCYHQQQWQYGQSRRHYYSMVRYFSTTSDRPGGSTHCV
jgi:hypothetical protein